MAEIKAEIKFIINQYLRKLKEEGIEIKKTFLFGSYASGKENKWSDIDLAIISDNFSKDRLNERIRLMRISSSIDTRLEPVPYRPENFTESDPLVFEIKKNGVEVK